MHEDEARDGPEDESLLRVRRPVLAEIEGALPHYQRHQNRQQHDGAAVEDSPSHLLKLYVFGEGRLLKKNRTGAALWTC